MLNKTHGANASVTGWVRKHRSVLFGMLAAVLASIGGVIWYDASVLAPQDVQRTSVRINGEPFTVRVVDTIEERTRGLGGSKPLESHEGMLFLFEQAGIHCFWMKDVSYSIDILWFGDDQRFVHAEEAVEPESYPKSFCPPEPTRYVVELPEGSVDKLDISEKTMLEVDNL